MTEQLFKNLQNYKAHEAFDIEALSILNKMYINALLDNEHAKYNENTEKQNIVDICTAMLQLFFIPVRARNLHNVDFVKILEDFLSTNSYPTIYDLKRFLRVSDLHQYIIEKETGSE